MQLIPHIIHQIWSSIDEPLPAAERELGETWKEYHPTWQYEFWDNARMNTFIQEHYPQYWEVYNRFPYHVQRWDAIRYLIMDKIGGLYVDFDYECIAPLDLLLEDKTCCFALECPLHRHISQRPNSFHNALMASVPQHPFIQKINDKVFSNDTIDYPSTPKTDCVMNTTGPYALTDLYNSLTKQEQEEIYLIPHQYVTPLNYLQLNDLQTGKENPEIEDCLYEAYAVHYFFNNWIIESN